MLFYKVGAQRRKIEGSPWGKPPLLRRRGGGCAHARRRGRAGSRISGVGAQLTQHGVQQVFSSPADQPARPGAALGGSSPSQSLPIPRVPPPPPSVSALAYASGSTAAPPRPAPRTPGPASRIPPRLPFLAAAPLRLVGPPPPPPCSPDSLSFLPSEDVLLPAQPQPAQGAARLHQGPRVGECGRHPRGGGREPLERGCGPARAGPEVSAIPGTGLDWRGGRVRPRPGPAWGGEAAVGVESVAPRRPASRAEPPSRT